MKKQNELSRGQIITLQGKKPAWGQNVFLAPGAFLVGDVLLGDNCSLWFHAVIRGDVNSIRIGHRVNIQDGAIVHCTYQKAATTIGSDVSIGHRALVHGCTIADKALVGMGAIVMDHAEIGEGSILAAGAVVKERTVVPPGELWAGVPAKKIRDLSRESAAELQDIAQRYLRYKGWYHAEGIGSLQEG